MRRRNVLRGLAAMALLPGLALPQCLAAATRLIRRVRPGMPGWPDAAKWHALSAAVGGNLIEVQPLLGACKSDVQGAGCQGTLKDLRNPFFLGDQAGGTQVSGWLDAWTPAPSVYAVHAREAREVAAAVNFAREHNLRLVVKGTGHSYLGTSNAPDSLLIWTRAMNEVVLHDSFVAQGCEGSIAPVPAVSAGAGAMWIDLYHAVTAKGGRYVQGGGCSDVGVAGLVQSGGFGSFSKGFGTAAAGLLEAQIVTADGQVRIANPCTHPDLFWALKGGGGGSWGVVTRVTLRTHPLPEYFGAAWARSRPVPTRPSGDSSRASSRSMPRASSTRTGASRSRLRRATSSRYRWSARGWTRKRRDGRGSPSSSGCSPRPGTSRFRRSSVRERAALACGGARTRTTRS